MPSIPTLVMAASSVTITPKAASKMGVDMRIVARTSVKVNTSESLNNFRPSLPVGDAPPDDNDGLGRGKQTDHRFHNPNELSRNAGEAFHTHSPRLKGSQEEGHKGQGLQVVAGQKGHHDAV